MQPARKRQRKEWLLGFGLIALPVIMVLLFLFYPAILTILDTFYHPDANGVPGWSIATYQFFLSDGYSLANLQRTVWTTAVTCILLVAVNLPIAIYLRFATGRLAAVVQALALFPMFVPGIIICFAMVRYIGPNGLLQNLLEHVGIHGFQTPYLTPWGPVIGLLWDGMPFTLLVLTAGMGNISKLSIEAARDVGAGRGRILVSIILPQLANSLMVVLALNVLYLFATALMPFMLGPTSPEMMGPFMLRTFSKEHNPLMAGTQATITFLICSAAGLAYVRSISKRKEGRE